MPTANNSTSPEMPISRAPWLAPKGIALLFVIVAMFCAAFFCASLFEKNVSVFLAMGGACACLLLATAYLETLAIWRRAKLGALQCKFDEDKTTLRKCPGDKLTLYPKLTSALKTPLNLTHVSLISTSHLQFTPIERISLNAASDNKLSLEAKLSHRGPAAICAFLIKFSGPAELFYAEISIPHQHDIDLLAQHPTQTRAKRPMNARPAGDPEFDRIRPFTQGDALNRIFWRGYAKTGELMTRVFVPEPTTRHIAILIDATPSMLAPKQTAEAPLFNRIPEIEELAFGADEVTLIACTHNEMRTYARKLPPHALLKVLDSFSISALLFNTSFTARAWPLVSRKLWFDLAYSNSLDFSVTKHGNPMIDTPHMVKWLRAYLVQKHPNLASRLIKASDAAIASFYMRERRIELILPSQGETPNFMLAVKHISTLRPDVRPQEIYLAMPSGILNYKSLKQCSDSFFL